MKDAIVLGIIVLILFLAIRYVVNQKKKGVKCIGCASADACSKKDLKQGCGGSCGCNDK